MPWVQWECLNEIFSAEKADRLLAGWGGKDGKPDYVVDAIDNIDSKVALLQYCHSHDIPVVSSMGAGCKSDPTRVCVGDISASTEDPLSRTTRRRLRLLGIAEGIPVVFSTEKPGEGKAQLLPLPEEEFIKGQVNQLSILPDFRARILPVLGTMPAVFGYAIANFIVLEITGYPHEASGGKGRDKLYEDILGRLQALGEKIVRSIGADAVGLKIPVTKDDVGYLVEEVYRRKSVVSGLPTKLSLIPWKKPVGGWKVDESYKGQKLLKGGVELENLVCMTKEEAAVHEKEVLRGSKKPEDVYDTGVVALVERRMEEERGYSRYR